MSAGFAMWKKRSKSNREAKKEGLRRELVSLLPRLRRFSRGLTKDPVVADDLVQEACERALTRLDQVRDGTRFDSWMYRIVHTRWIDWLRKGKVRSEHLSMVPDKDAPDAIADGRAENPGVGLDVRRALQTLPPDQLAAVMLVCVEGYSYSEAAKILTVPAGTVASRVARGKGGLGRKLFSETDTVGARREADEVKS